MITCFKGNKRGNKGIGMAMGDRRLFSRGGQNFPGEEQNIIFA